MTPVLPDKAVDGTDFFPLPDGYTLEPEPFSDAQIADLKALFGTAVPPRHPGSL